MHEVIVDNYQPADGWKFVFRDRKEFENIIEKNPSYFLYLPQITNGNTYCIRKNGNIIAIVGWVSDTFVNKATVFFFASEDLDKQFDKYVLIQMRSIFNFMKSKYVRLEAVCIEDPRNKRFLEFFGFKQECLMKKAGFDSTDLYLYSLVQ